jgi:hypothetical protein
MATPNVAYEHLTAHSLWRCRLGLSLGEPGPAPPFLWEGGQERCQPVVVAKSLRTMQNHDMHQRPGFEDLMAMWNRPSQCVCA